MLRPFFGQIPIRTANPRVRMHSRLRELLLKIRNTEATILPKPYGRLEAPRERGSRERGGGCGCPDTPGPEPKSRSPRDARRAAEGSGQWGGVVHRTHECNRPSANENDFPVVSISASGSVVGPTIFVSTLVGAGCGLLPEEAEEDGDEEGRGHRGAEGPELRHHRLEPYVGAERGGGGGRGWSPGGGPRGMHAGEARGGGGGGAKGRRALSEEQWAPDEGVEKKEMAGPASDCTNHNLLSVCIPVWAVTKK